MTAVNGWQYPKLQFAAAVAVINAAVNFAQELLQASKVALHAILKTNRNCEDNILTYCDLVQKSTNDMKCSKKDMKYQLSRILAVLYQAKLLFHFLCKDLLWQ